MNDSQRFAQLNAASKFPRSRFELALKWLAIFPHSGLIYRPRFHFSEMGEIARGY